MARKGLPRKYAKMGFKRGWKAYKSRSKAVSSRIKRIKSNKKINMPRRRKKRYSRKRSKGVFGTGLIWNTILGAGTYVVYDSFVSPLIPVSGTLKNVVEFGLGLMLSRQRGFIGAFGKTAVVVNAVQLMRLVLPLAGVKTFTSGAVTTNGIDVA